MDVSGERTYSRLLDKASEAFSAEGREVIVNVVAGMDATYPQERDAPGLTPAPPASA